MVQRDTFRGFGIATADRLKHESLFLDYLIEPWHQRREAPHRDVNAVSWIRGYASPFTDIDPLGVAGVFKEGR